MLSGGSLLPGMFRSAIGAIIDIQYQSKVWTHLLIQLSEKVCPNF